MRVVTVKHTLPSTKVSNDEVLDWIRGQGHVGLSDQQHEAVIQQIKEFLTQAGTSERHIACGTDRPIDFVLTAARNALDDAGMDPGEIDFVIYTGVGRGWIEPAMATIVQAELKLARASSFDVIEACAGWLRSLQIAHGLIESKSYRRGLIVNCECGLLHYLHWNASCEEDIENRLASYTVGEAATATIVDDQGGDHDFYFRFQSYGEHFNLCMIPLDNLKGFTVNGHTDDNYHPMKFYTRTRKLFSTTIRKLVEEYNADERMRTAPYDICFTHAPSERAVDMLIGYLGFRPDAVYRTHGRYGNTVSASVPLGMSLALEEGRLKRGDRVAVFVGSAGISIGLANFVY
jgi:3-oxoacyl-[acyl-carrier-protein] synthase III